MSTGLYRPEDVRDNCGFGLIAHMQGKASHELLATAIESLTCMTHRGGIAADGKTGDGCGLLLKKPDAFLRKVAKDAFGGELSELYGIGQIFLSQDEAKATSAREAVAGVLADNGLQLAGWREVPVDASVCGEIALASLPRIEQLFINVEGLSAQELTTKLFVVRRQVEIALADDSEFYICSLSADVVSYKGLVMPVDLPHFYLDLANPELETAICVFHLPRAQNSYSNTVSACIFIRCLARTRCSAIALP